MKNFLLSFAMLLTIVSCGGDNGLTPDEPDTPDTPPTEQPDTPPTDEPDTPPTDEPDTPPTDEPETPPTDEPDTPPVEETIYSATIEFAEQFGFEWSDNTSISLFTSTQNEKFAYDAASARFKKADASQPSNIATPKVFGVYPYSSKNEVSEDGTVTLTIPMVQAYKAEGVDFAITPMLAVAEAENNTEAEADTDADADTDTDTEPKVKALEFEHLFGYVEIPIYALLSDDTQSLAIKRVKLTAANDKPIAGYVSFKTSDVSDANYSFDFDPALSSSYVTVDCGEGVTAGTSIETATSFHFILPAATYADGLRIEITGDNGRVFKFDIASDVTVARGEVLTLETIEIGPDAPPVEETTYSATIESAEQFGFEWSDNTSISLFTSTQNEQFAYDAASARFKKADASNPTRIETPKIFGVYPYNYENRASKSGEITFVAPIEQPYKAGDVDFTVNPMLAVAELDTTELEFKHLFGYLNIPIYTLLPEGISALTIKSVKFTSANGKSIAGTAYFDTANVSDANYNFKFGMAGCSYVVLNCGEGVVVGKSAETATSLRFVLPPATYDSGCTIEITDTNGISLSKTISSFTIESGEVTVVPAAEIVIDSYPKAPESVLANIQWSNDTEGKPGAFDAAKGLPVETIYLGNQTQNLWVTDAPEGYTLNKIATFGKDEANLTYFNLEFTNVKDQIQDGFTIEVLHRRSHQGSFGENGWCGLFGGRDFGLWLACNDGFKWDARIWDGAKDANYGTNQISADVWHHTVYIYNAETEKLQVYTDGKLEVDKACGKMRTITSDYLPIGARMFSDGTKIKFPWGGDIALFKIYDETVGKNEISIMYKDIQGQIDALNGARAK